MGGTVSANRPPEKEGPSGAMCEWCREECLSDGSNPTDARRLHGKRTCLSGNLAVLDGYSFGAQSLGMLPFVTGNQAA